MSTLIGVIFVLRLINAAVGSVLFAVLLAGGRRYRQYMTETQRWAHASLTLYTLGTAIYSVSLYHEHTESVHVGLKTLIFVAADITIMITIAKYWRAFVIKKRRR